MRRVSVFGATGSVGRNTVALLEAQGGAEAYEVVALTGAGNVALLAEQARRLRARVAVTADPARLAELEAALAGSGTEAAAGPEALCAAAAEPVDWAMSAIVGAAGLAPGLELARHGGVLALANKESMVCAGELMRRTCAAHGTRLIPADSEHSAIFQAMRGERADEVERVILTASGGPFRDWTVRQMATATPAQARAHPNWDMGERISIDSATMFNKALEVIEARELFGLEPDQIEVVVHPQSIVHSMVGFRDGAMIAQLGVVRHAGGHRLRAELARAPAAAGAAARPRGARAARLPRRPTRSASRRCGWRAGCSSWAGSPARCSTPPRRRRSTPIYCARSAFLTWRCSWNMCWSGSGRKRPRRARATISAR